MDKGSKVAAKPKAEPKKETPVKKEEKKAEAKPATPAPAKKEEKKVEAKPATPTPAKKEEKKVEKKPEAKAAPKGAAPAKKDEKKVEKKPEAKAAPKAAAPKKDEKKVEKKTEKKEEKKTEKKTEKKAEKKEEKKTEKTEKKEEKKGEKKVAKKEEKKVEKKEEKKVVKKAEVKKGDKKKKKKHVLMRIKDPKIKKMLAKTWKNLPPHAAHAKKLKLKRKQRFIRFSINCAQQANDRILKPRELEQYLKGKIKVNGKTHNLAKKVATRLVKNKVIVLARPPFAKRYLKYLTRRFLKKQSLRDWVRIVASGRNGYRMRYYKIESPEEEAEA